MKKIISVLIWMLVLIQVACTSMDETIKSTGTIIETSGIKVIRFPEKGEDTLKTSYFADTVIYIPLETSSKSLVKKIWHLWMDDTIILIANNSNLLMFSRKGKFIRQIGKHGKGPGEYQYVFNFEVISDTIYLSSSGKRSLMKFAMDGTFHGEIQMKGQPFYFSSTTDGKLAWYKHHEGEIYIHDKGLSSADTITVEYGVTKGRHHYVHSNSFTPHLQKTSSGLLFNSYRNDTIWDVTTGKKEPAYILDMKEKLLPYDKQIEFIDGDFDKWHKVIRPYLAVHIIPFTSRMIVFERHWGEDNCSAIYLRNSVNKEMKKYNTSYIYDDMVGQQRIPEFVLTSSQNNYLIGKIYSHELKEELDSNNERIKEKASPLWLNQMKDVDKNDNPILVLMKIKK